MSKDFRPLLGKTKKFVCKHCKVQVCGRYNTSAILGHEHKKSCPRRRPRNDNFQKVK